MNWKKYIDTKHIFGFGYGIGSQYPSFVCYWWTTGLSHVSFGFHFDWRAPNIEIHLPLGFFRIGWRAKPVRAIIRRVPK